MNNDLEKLIKQEIVDAKEKRLGSRVVEFRDAKNKFIVPKSTVIVEVALKEGIILKIDITDKFSEVL
jgi:RNase P/RNase MRP subunit p29